MLNTDDRKILFAVLLLTSIAFLLMNCSQQTEEKDSIPKIEIRSEMTAPGWALEERRLFEMYDSAARIFAGKYLDENGFLKVVERWGGNDGPDDAMENFSQWPLMYALGGSEFLRSTYEKAWEGHLVQFTRAKAPDVEMAKDGMFYKEFITSFDWEHNGEGLSAFNFYSLVNPGDSLYRERTKRFVGFYMNEDPEAPNYDPEHKIIRSLHNGSRGPKLTDASEMDWGGEPVDGAPERLTRYKDAGNIRGDHPLNLLTTTLAMNAFMLTGEEKYRNWLLEYAGAWRDRILQNDGNIPSNVGLDGTIGGEWEGNWYGGVFGWNFDPSSPVRNYSFRGPRVAFGNAFMLTADTSFIEPLKLQMENLFQVAKQRDSMILLPNKYGEKGWYGYIPNRHTGLLRDIFLWRLENADLQHLENDPWINFLQGKNPGFPEDALRWAQRSIQRKIEQMSVDSSTSKVRDTDDIQRYNPVQAGIMTQLTTGGNDPGIMGNILHCRVRYFDPVMQRPGLPDGVAALVENISQEGIELTLINTNKQESRTVILQAGAYGEHRFNEVKTENEEIKINDKRIKVRIEPGAGNKLSLKMSYYVNTPSLALPW